jgi:hypothetical protein
VRKKCEHLLLQALSSKLGVLCLHFASIKNEPFVTKPKVHLHVRFCNAASQMIVMLKELTKLDLN